MRVRSPLLAQSLLFSLPPGNEMFQFPGFASLTGRDDGVASIGLPHSEIRGSTGICPSPRLIAACHVLLRLREPRHPSCALVSFPYFFSPDPTCRFTAVARAISCHNFYRCGGEIALFLLLSLLVTSLTCVIKVISFTLPSCQCATFLVVPGRVELPTSTLSV